MITRANRNELRSDLIRYGKIVSDVSDGLNRSRIFSYSKTTYCMVERNGDIVCIVKGDIIEEDK